MLQDRFLRGILIGIAVLAVLATALFFLRQSRQEYSEEDTPQGVVQNYVLALQKGDYQRAYGYLSANGQPEFSKFRLDLLNQRSQFADAAVEVLSVQVMGKDANVSLSILRNNGGLFGDLSREAQSAALIQENAKWKIAQMPYPFWSFDWYQLPLQSPAP
jgi:hypothetical protein